MFIIFLRFSKNKTRAGEFMEGHKEWLKQGFDAGVFLVAGSLQPNLGGGIVVHNCTRSDIEHRLAADPFVVEDVVTAEITEFSPAFTDDRLKFLLD